MKKLVLLITVIILLTGCEISFSTNTDNFDNAYFKDVVNCVRENVNMGKNVQFYEEGALLLIPISSRNACSPDFNDSSYKYAFVGLTYNNEYYRSQKTLKLSKKIRRSKFSHKTRRRFIL